MLTTSDLCTLLYTGDKRAMLVRLQAIRLLKLTLDKKEYPLTVLALRTNLDSLVLHQPSNTDESKLDWRVLPLITTSHLTTLVFYDVTYRGALPLQLPPTLTSLKLLSGSLEIVRVSLNGAKLTYLCINHNNPSQHGSTIAVSLIKTLVMPCVSTLEHLDFRGYAPVPLDLSGHTRLTVYALDIQQLLSKDFVPPPAATTVYISGHVGIIIHQIFSVIGRSVTTLSFRLARVSWSSLDITDYGHLELLDVEYFNNGIICAPNGSLRILCRQPPPYVINRGPGRVSIEASKLVLFNGKSPHTSALQNINWSCLNSVELDYANDRQHTDYSPLAQATNINRLAITGDSLEGFAARDGFTFFQHFARITQMDWHIKFEVCLNLVHGGIILPPLLANLYVAIEADWAITETMKQMSPSQLLPLLNWLNPVPKKLVLKNFPLIPRAIDLCNQASPLQDFCFLSFIHTATSDTLVNLPTFTPTPNLQKVDFRFCVKIPDCVNTDDCVEVHDCAKIPNCDVKIMQNVFAACRRILGAKHFTAEYRTDKYYLDKQ